jgi:hypothetical protein
MKHCHTKLDDANVIAGFDNQWDAEEAVLGLRMSGISDDHIGYYSQDMNGKVTDLLGRSHRPLAMIIGGVLGAVLGVIYGQLVDRSWFDPGQSPNTINVMVVCAVFGCLFLGTAGGMIGLWNERPLPANLSGACRTEAIVLAVNAGDRRDEVWSIIRRHGGYVPGHSENAVHEHIVARPAAYPV